MADSTPPGSSKVVLLVIRMFCLAVAVFLAGTISARAEGDTLYGALILATNAEHPAPPPQELSAQAATLHTVFGYNEFRLLGQKRQPTPKDPEDWLVASRQFFLRVNTKNAVAGGYALGLELRKEDRVIIAVNVTLSRERPLFIRGPFAGQGQIIILMMVL